MAYHFYRNILLIADLTSERIERRRYDNAVFVFVYNPADRYAYRYYMPAFVAWIAPAAVVLGVSPFDSI